MMPPEELKHIFPLDNRSPALLRSCYIGNHTLKILMSLRVGRDWEVTVLAHATLGG